MRYVARRPLTIGFKGGEGVSYKPGEVVAEFDSLPALTRRALINTGRVEFDARTVLEDGTCAACGQKVPAKKAGKP